MHVGRRLPHSTHEAVSPLPKTSLCGGARLCGCLGGSCGALCDAPASLLVTEGSHGPGPGSWTSALSCSPPSEWKRRPRAASPGQREEGWGWAVRTSSSEPGSSPRQPSPGLGKRGEKRAGWGGRGSDPRWGSSSQSPCWGSPSSCRNRPALVAALCSVRGCWLGQPHGK